MTAEPDVSKSVNISIVSEAEEQSQVPVVLLADVFRRIQNILYHIVDHLEGNPPRSRGDFPIVTKERCELVVAKIGTGSISAVLDLSERQVALPGMPTFGTRAISVAGDVFNAILAEDLTEENIEFRMIELIDDKRRVNRILREFEPMWPDEKSEYTISFGFGIHRARNLDPVRKPVVSSYLHRPPEKYEKTIIGRLMELRVDRKRRFQVDTAEGIVTCQYNPEVEEHIRENIGNLVRVQGMMKLRKGVYTLRVDHEDSLETIPRLPLNKIRLKDRDVSLKEPMHIDIIYDNDLYISTCDKLKLRVTANNLKEVLEGLNEEMEMLWEDYVEAGEDVLSEDALQLRNEILSMFDAEDINALS
ncbi:MAG: hypothetical protein U9N48_00820 [Euryarchaeota archaeon]|nr:hypothetical protein [Euryarchaeota archaeon]